MTSEDDMGLFPFYKHAIQITGLPGAKHPYRIPLKHKEWLINKIQELEKNWNKYMYMIFPLRKPLGSIVESQNKSISKQNLSDCSLWVLD